MGARPPPSTGVGWWAWLAEGGTRTIQSTAAKSGAGASLRSQGCLPGRCVRFCPPKGACIGAFGPLRAPGSHRSDIRWLRRGERRRGGKRGGARRGPHAGLFGPGEEPGRSGPARLAQPGAKRPRQLCDARQDARARRGEAAGRPAKGRGGWAVGSGPAEGEEGERPHRPAAGQPLGTCRPGLFPSRAGRCTSGGNVRRRRFILPRGACVR